MSEYKPNWVKKLEKLAEEQELKSGKCGKKIKKPWENKANFVGSVIGNLIALFIITNVQTWWPEFFTSSWVTVYEVARMVIIIQIGIGLLRIVFSPRWFYYLSESANNIFGLISITTAIMVFPFNVPYGLGTLFKIGLTIGAIVTIIAGAVYLIKALFAALNPLR